MKKIVILSTSLRQNSNSDRLAKEFARGAIEAGHEVTYIRLLDKNIHFCIGCLACQKSGVCVLQDDMTSILAAMKAADSIVFATPIYYYEMRGQMKTLLDRSNPLFSAEYQFRDIYLLMSAAEEEEDIMERTVQSLGGWIECFDKTVLKGVVRGVGVTDVNEMKEKEEFLLQAYKLGKQA